MILQDVERLYCKRPILCLSSSKILTPRPDPLTARRVCTHPPFGAGGGHPRWVEKGVGRSIFWKTRDTALYSTYVNTLCCRIFWRTTLWRTSCTWPTSWRCASSKYSGSRYQFLHLRTRYLNMKFQCWGSGSVFGSVSHKYGSGSFHHQAKIVRKNLISTGL